MFKRNALYEEVINPLPESIDSGDYVIATYFMETGRDINYLERAAAIAIEQSTGTWVEVPGETKENREKFSAKVLGVYEVPDFELFVPKEVERRRFVLRIAFPHVHYGDHIPMLLTTVVGNLSGLGKIKLLDLEFPEKLVKSFAGPKFGISGIRKLLGVEDRPLLNNMIKPCNGISPEFGAELCYQAALGGTDIVKDDELIGDAYYSPLIDRVKAYMESVKRADEEKGEKTLYAVNISGSASTILDNAKRAIDAGVNCLMVNYLTVGLSVTRMLAEDPEINVPILGHGDFSGAIYSSSTSGVSSPLIVAKLARLCGVDMLIDVVSYGKVPFLNEKYIRAAQVLRAPLYHIEKSLPIVGAGVHAGMVGTVVSDIGKDSCFGVGGAIHGHPMGAAAGARAMRQAIDSVMDGIALEDAAENYEELRVAIDKWGIYNPEVNIFKSIKD